jgi:hypothetical protein
MQVSLIMTKEASQSNALNSLRAQVEADFANVLRRLDNAENPKSKIAYPWNPAESEEFFNELEQDFSWNLSDEEISIKSKSFFAQVDQLFSASSLEASLAHKFATVPQAWLNAIAKQAQQVASSSAVLADQLVQCVQDVLPTWAEDDLQVLARPLAYAMRGDDTDVVDSTVSKIRPVAWEELSETEQAKLSLAVARYALSKLDN